MGEPRQNFAMDAIQEFKVSTSTYKAEYGLATGGLLTVVTKSGTNSLHGSGLLFFRDKASTPRLREAERRVQGLPSGTSKPDFRRYQYGGTVGGPIVQNKTHYFFAYEGTERESVLHGERRADCWPQYEGIFKSAQERWTYNGKLDHQLSDAEPVLPLRRARTSTVRSSPPAERRAAERELRFRGAAILGGASATPGC